MADTERPLSPHLQVYRWQLTMSLSILHRITGFGLGVGAAMAAWWLVAAASGPEAWAVFHDFCKSVLGQLMLAGWLFALVYHFLNGIRHLFWDAGKGFSLKAAYASGWTVVALSILFTAVLWFGRVHG